MRLNTFEYQSTEVFMRLTDDHQTRRLYAEMIRTNFKENDWMVTVRLFGVEDKEKFICDLLNKVTRKVYPNRSFRKDNPNCLKTFAVIGWRNENGDNHAAAHILIEDVDYRNESVSSFKELLLKTFRKNRTMAGDVDVTRVWDVDGASNYVLLEQGHDVTVVNNSIRLKFDDSTPGKDH